MKKNYEKPCCSSMVVAVEQAMLAGSDKGLRITNQDFERANHTTLGPSTAGGAKKNPFDYDEE
jgi:hypothetical protein